MWIDVFKLLKSSIGTTSNYDVDGYIDVLDSGNPSRVQGELSLVRTHRGILVKGTLRTGVDIECVRCLEPFSCPLVLEIEEEFFPVRDAHTGAALPVPDDPNILTIDEDYALDLDEAVRQYVLTAIPMKPICREECPGLCPQCGCNLNLGACGCSQETAGLRRPVLRNLSEKEVNSLKGIKS